MQDLVLSIMPSLKEIGLCVQTQISLKHIFFKITETKFFTSQAFSVDPVILKEETQQTIRGHSLNMVCCKSCRRSWTLNVLYHTTPHWLRWKTCTAYRAWSEWESTFHPLSTERNTFNTSIFKTKLSHFLFSPYRIWFWSLNCPH